MAVCRRAAAGAQQRCSGGVTRVWCKPGSWGWGMGMGLGMGSNAGGWTVLNVWRAELFLHTFHFISHSPPDCNGSGLSFPLCVSTERDGRCHVRRGVTRGGIPRRAPSARGQGSRGGFTLYGLLCEYVLYTCMCMCHVISLSKCAHVWRGVTRGAFHGVPLASEARAAELGAHGCSVPPAPKVGCRRQHQ